MKELLLGCGSRTKKDLVVNDKKDFEDVVRLDINADHKPDVVWDLRNHPLPFKDEEFDEIHAYEVLEHLAQQGDYEFFFKEFTEYHRILKPGGLFLASCPQWNSFWAFGDPSHKRIISKGTITFLDQDHYKDVGTTQVSDFRYLYKANFKTIYIKDNAETFYFILRKA